jgi:hypothetical protein
MSAVNITHVAVLVRRPPPARSPRTQLEPCSLSKRCWPSRAAPTRVRPVPLHSAGPRTRWHGGRARQPRRESVRRFGQESFDPRLTNAAGGQGKHGRQLSRGAPVRGACTQPGTQSHARTTQGDAVGVQINAET